jgi:hypothetical protein
VRVRSRVFFGLALELDMAPIFSKGQRVRVAATKFDNENRDNGGMNFSEGGDRYGFKRRVGGSFYWPH